VSDERGHFKWMASAAQEENDRGTIFWCIAFDVG